MRPISSSAVELSYLGIREFTYLYGAISPKDGGCRYLIMPAADSEGFQIIPAWK
jgi:hypothetical protein